MLDGNKLFEIITNDTELKDVPIIYIAKVTESVINAINSGDCLINIWKE